MVGEGTGAHLSHCWWGGAPRAHHKEVTVLPQGSSKAQLAYSCSKTCFFQLLSQAPSKDKKYYFRSADIRDVLLKNCVKTCFEFQNETFYSEFILKIPF